MSNSLTITEKEHWKDRIAKRIGRQIDKLCAEEPGFLERVDSDAKQCALESLGVAKLRAQLDRIEQQQAKLKEREEQIEAKITATVLGIPLRKAHRGYHLGDVRDAVAKQQATHRDEVLAKTPRGREILDLEQEQDHLLDTVWLATSSKQIKDLWTKVDEMLGGDETKLQREALAIDPVKAE